MKRIAYYLTVLALAVFTFTSCEDVPSPFGQIVAPKTDDVVVVEPSGTGTQADPYNVAAVIEYLGGLGADVPSPNEVYIVGYITSITEAFGTQYGNATFEISDSQEGGNKFLCYRVLYLGNQKYSDPSATNIKEGDKVVICGKVVNYKGNTPETQANGAYVYSINGTGGGTTPTPTEEVKKVTVAEFNAAAESATQYYQLTGTVKNLKDGDQYGNFDLEDATGSVYVYGLLAEKGGESKKFQELAAAKGIKNGVTLTINGLRSSYNNKVQVKSAYFVSVEAGSGGGGDTPSGDGDGTENNPYNVAAAIAKANQTGVFVKAFIVGFVDGQVYTEGANFSSASTTQTNILIAGSADEKNVANCMPVQLPTGDIRTKLNLKDNAGNYKKEVLLYGDITKYFGVPGLKNTSYAVIDGNSIGTNPNGGGGGGSSTDEVKTVSVADFIAASESDTQWYKLTGTVKNLKDGDQYGNFDIEDATGSVYVYGLLSEKGGEKKKFQELAAAKGIKNGSKITIIGLRSSYNGSVQVKNAYFVSIEEGGSSGGGGSTATGADGSTIISVADFNAAAESTSVWYQLTGTVKNLKDNDQYGNFDLEDSTGSVYVYGLLSEKGGAKKKFQDLVAAKGIANGKKITIVGNRGSYNGKIEVMNAYFIKIE